MNKTPTRDEIIRNLMDSGLVERYSHNLYMWDWADFRDTLQDIWLQILMIPEEKLIGLWRQTNSMRNVTGYVSGLIHRNLRTDGSLPYYNYVKRACHGKNFERIEDAYDI